jgi:hypothetical protein
MRRDRSQKMENSGQVEAANRVHAVATDKRGVTRSQPHIPDSPRKFRLAPNSGRVITALMPAAESTTRNSVSRINCTGAPGRPHMEAIGQKRPWDRSEFGGCAPGPAAMPAGTLTRCPPGRTT